MKATSALVAVIIILSTASILFLSLQEISAQSTIEKVSLAQNKIRLRSGTGVSVLDLELLQNTEACIVDCYAIVKLHPYQHMKLPSSATDDFKWEFLKAKSQMAGLLSTSFQVLKNVTQKRTVLDYRNETRYYPNPINSSDSAFTIPSMCSDYNATHYRCITQEVNGSHEENTTKEEYASFDFWGTTLESDKDYYLKIVGKKKAAIGTNDIDWIPTIEGIRISEWAWWNTTWAHKKQINITDVSNTAFTDYPIVITDFNCENNCNTSGQDIRVVANDVSELQFGLQKINSTFYNITFWSNVTQANGTNSSYYLYYGNPAAPATNQSWNRSRYNYYADFEPSSPNVTTHNGSFTVQPTMKYAGSYALKGTGNGSSINGVASLPSWNVTDTGILLESMKLDDENDGASWDGFILLSDSNSLSASDTLKNSLRALWSGENSRIDHTWFNSSAQQLFVSSNTSCSLDEVSWHLHHVTWFRNNKTLFSATDGCSLTSTSMSPVITGNPSGAVGLYTYPNTNTYYDNIAFRKYLVPEPTLVIGAEESNIVTNEAIARSAITEGIQQSSIGPSPFTYTDIQLYVRLSNGTQTLGRFDKAVAWGSQRWAFNYITSGENFTALAGLGQTLNVWENQTLSASEIANQVAILINSTKQ